MEQRGMELVNPEGIVLTEPFKLPEHPPVINGKTVLLRWNGKHNGDIFLDTVAEMIKGKIKDVKIIKSWEAAPETARSSGSPDASREYTEKLAGLKPDLVIGSQAD